MVRQIMVDGGRLAARATRKTWSAYEALVENLGDDRHLRLTCDGEILEILSPGSRHDFLAFLLFAGLARTPRSALLYGKVKTGLLRADSVGMGMAINVAGTNALGDYLVSEIANARELIAGATSVDSVSPAALALQPPQLSTPLTQSQLLDQVRAQELANTQILFGLPSTADTSASMLPPIPGQTAQQLTNVSVQSSRIALQFSTIATLFGWDSLGANTNLEA